MADEQCAHGAYEYKNKDLKCVGCGASSPSEKWRANMGLEDPKAEEPKDNKARKGGENKSK